MDKRVYIIFGAAALLLLAFFVITREKPSKYSWLENYEEERKDPYSTFVIHRLLADYFPSQSLVDLNEPISESLPLPKNTEANYVFIGEGMYFDTSDVNRLLRFVENGNTAFISSKTIPHDLMYYVYSIECNGHYWEDYNYNKDTSVYVNIFHRDFSSDSAYYYEFIQKHEPKAYRWNYIDSLYFCEQPYSFVELGSINDSLINFAMIQYGEGQFYFHTTPILFSNYNLLESKGVDYVSRVFSHLADGKIYWDAHSRVEEELSRRRNQLASNGPRGRDRSESPLKYVLAQPSLAWAWYLLLSLGLLYMLFRAKRRQRIIPVLAPNTNSSLEFISTIGTLYFLQNDHKKLCLEKMKLFLAFARERYQINTNELDEAFTETLAFRSEISTEVINKILVFYNNIKNSNFVSEKTLIEFHLEMDKFYQHCK